MAFSTEQAIEAIHAATFGVPPDAERLAAFAAEVDGDPVALSALALRLNAFAERLRGLQVSSLPDHSQHGEHRLLLRHLIGSSSGTRVIVDVGAHGRGLSNSYDLMATFGWRGVLIEANPGLLPSIRDGFATLDYQLFGCAVGVQPGRLPFHIGANDAVSSLSLAQARLWGETRGEIMVEVRRLPDILVEAAVPHDFDVMSIDIEGHDVPVFNDLIATSPYRPRLVLIESALAETAAGLDDIGIAGAALAGYRIVDRLACNLLLAPA